MDRRARLASIIAVTATLSTGGLAAWTTTGALQAANADETPGKVQLVDDTSRASTSDDQAATEQSPGTAAAESETPEPAGGPTVAATGAPVAATPVTAATSTQQGRSETSPGAPESDSPTPPSTAAPVVDDPPSTAPGGVDCHGSDDGMTEAQKHAREAACEHGGDDD